MAETAVLKEKYLIKNELIFLSTFFLLLIKIFFKINFFKKFKKKIKSARSV
jgi:hypothetical protein